MREPPDHQVAVAQMEPPLSAAPQGSRRRFLSTLGDALNTFVTFVFLLAILSVVASIPVANVLVLGYLMEVQARIARNGKLSSALYLLPEAKRLGTIFLGVALWLIPVQFMASLVRDSRLLAPGSTTALLLMGALILTSLFVAVHLLMAIGCGGRWWQFVRPIRNYRWLRQWNCAVDYWQQAHLEVRQFFAAIKFLHLAKLGLLGYATVYLWLTIPAYLFTQLDDVTIRWQIVGFMLGCGALVLALLWLPMLLIHVAVAGRAGAMLEHKTVRQLTQRVPLRWTIATVILFGFSILPMLYVALVKAQLPPHTVQWDLMIVFLVTALPARILHGWVYHCGKNRMVVAAVPASISGGQPPIYLDGLVASSTPVVSKSSPLGWGRLVWYYTNVLVLLVAVGSYVYFLYLAETGGELGQRAIWQFHSLLQPWTIY